MKRFKVIMDVAAFPKGMAPELWVKLCDNNYVFYDSTTGNRPKIVETGLATEEVEVEPVLIDVKGEQVELKDIQAIWAEQDFWDKALFKCKKSPIHYYTDYLCGVARHTQEGLNEYLKSIGLGATDDSEDVMSEKAKAAMLAYTESITLENIKNLKAIRDVEVEKYDKITEQLRLDAQRVFELTDEKLLRKSITTVIMKTPSKQVPEKYKVYITKSAKWDGAMLRTTEDDVLFRMWEELC